MSDDIYKKLAQVLDTLPNGFPSTDSGLEIKILKKVFTPGEAELFCDLKLNFETAEQIAARTGRPLEGLEEKLRSMGERGEIQGVNIAGTWIFKMIPWIVGIYEFNIDRMDEEFARMCEEYLIHFGPPLIKHKPEIMKVVPVEEEIPSDQEAMPYNIISSILEKSQDFMVNECICNKEKKLLNKGCDKPKEICMGLSPVPGVFDTYPRGRKITREEAHAILKKAEEKALVHLSTNTKEGIWFICNCCGCCCPVLGGVKLIGNANHINSSYYAEIDPDACSLCGTCRDERCQVEAIEEGDDTFRVIRDKCIGCGLCISTCPSEAISLKNKNDDEIPKTPQDEKEWEELRAKSRNVDFSKYK